MNQKIYWPFINVSVDTYIVVGWLLTALSIITVSAIIQQFSKLYVILPLLFLLYGIVMVLAGRNLKKVFQERRQATMLVTKSVLMSKAAYVGGHPLIPSSRSIVLGLSEEGLTIYSLTSKPIRAPILAFGLNKKDLIDKWIQYYSILVLASISLNEIVQTGMGRPKSAREVYDEDYVTTIDVYEQSPFLSIIFKLDGENYRASFQSFEAHTPLEFYNQITALKYKLLSKPVKS